MIAIGVPTVVDAATIVNDTMETLVEALDRSDEMKSWEGCWETLTGRRNIS